MFVNDISSTKLKANKKSSTKRILLEGSRLIKDAINAGAIIEKIYISRTYELQDLLLDPDCKIPVYRTLYKKMKMFSELVTCPGIMAICQLEEENVVIDKAKRTTLPITLICDNVRDPGNLGSIIRLAAGAGCQRVVLSKGCADPYESKVLRGASGAHFRIPMVSHVGWEYMGNYVPEDSQLFVASVVGNNESKGEDTVELVPGTSQNDYEIEIDEATGQQRKRNTSYNGNLTAFKNVPIDTHLYNAATVNPTKPAVLIIGGETHGISVSARKLAHENFGQKLYIPLLNGVESLNVSAATAIILFEIQKQYFNQLNKI